MLRTALFLVLASSLILAIACGGGGSETEEPTAAATSVMKLPQGDDPVELDPADFVLEIDNPYWPMRPGNHWVYSETDGDGAEMTVDVTVTNETKDIAGITATVVHDVVTEDGETIEDTFDWYAQDVDGNIWYLGEDTKEYENGKVVSTEGSWEHGVDGALAGVIMPANPVVGMAYRQEYYEGHAEDRAKIMSLFDHVEVAYDTFPGTLRTEDTTPLDSDILEHKYYAFGLGPVLAIDITGGGREELISFDEVNALELSPEEKVRIEEIILNDPGVAEVRGESSMEMDGVGVWHSGSTKLGGGVHIHFDPPVTREYEWPSVRFPSDGSATYERVKGHLRVEDMVEASVLVDLTSGAVVAIRPLSYGRFYSLDTPDPRWTGQPQN